MFSCPLSELASWLGSGARSCRQEHFPVRMKPAESYKWREDRQVGGFPLVPSFDGRGDFSICFSH